MSLVKILEISRNSARYQMHKYYFSSKITAELTYKKSPQTKTQRADLWELGLVKILEISRNSARYQMHKKFRERNFWKFLSSRLYL